VLHCWSFTWVQGLIYFQNVVLLFITVFSMRWWTKSKTSVIQNLPMLIVKFIVRHLDCSACMSSVFWALPSMAFCCLWLLTMISFSQFRLIFIYVTLWRCDKSDECIYIQNYCPQDYLVPGIPDDGHNLINYFIISVLHISIVRTLEKWLNIIFFLW